MKPAPFTYHRPRTLAEATACLAAVAPEDGRILAGGQTLVPMMALRLAYPQHLVDINEVKDLGRIAVTDDHLVVGALARHADFHRPLAAGPLGPLLATVVRQIAHYPIRLRGTFCGSLANADPASEWCLVAATLDAELEAQSTAGNRRLAARDFFQGIMTTALAPDEILTAVRLPLLPADTRWGFVEFSRRAGDYALGMSLVAFRLAEGRIAEPRIGLGGAEAQPRRIAAAEAVLAGERPSDALFRAAAEAAAAAIEPLEDSETDAAYRRGLVRTVVRRSLEAARRNGEAAA